MKTNTSLSLIPLLLFFTYTTMGQAINFEAFYGEESTNDYFNDIQPTADGGYIAVGESQSSGQLGEFYVVKLDADGNVEMEEKYGTAVGTETAHSVAVLADRYVIGGSTYIDGEQNKDCYLISIDFNGNLLTEVTFGGQGDDVIYAVTALNNGEIALAATYEDVLETGADILVRRYSADLDFLAEIDYQGPATDYPHFILEDSGTGNLLVGGVRNARGFLMSLPADLSSVLWITPNTNYTAYHKGVIYNEAYYAIGTQIAFANESYIGLVNKSTGEIEWSIPLPLLPSNSYRILDMEKKEGQIYLLADYLKPYFFRLDTLEFLFSEAFELPPNTSDLAVNEATGFTVTSQPLSPDYKVARVQQFDENFNETWETTVGNFDSHSTQAGMQVVEVELGQMLLGGETSYGSENVTNILIQKVELDGDLIWATEFNTNTANRFEGMAKTTDNGCLVAVTYKLPGSNFVKLGFQKINPDGSLGWFQTVDDLNIVSLREGNLVSDANDSFYFSAIASGQSVFGTYVLKLDASGSIIWESAISEETEFVGCKKMVLAANQDLILSGETQTLEGRIPTLCRLDSDGELLWKILSPTPDNFNSFEGLIEDDDGHIIVLIDNGEVAQFSSDGTLMDALIMEVPNMGTELKDICIGSNGEFYMVDDTYKFSGDTILTIFNLERAKCTRIHVFDHEYNFMETQSYGVGLGTYADHIIAHTGGGFVVFGQATEGNNQKGHLIRMDAEGVSSTIDIQAQGRLKILPTVSDGHCTIDFSSPHQGDFTVHIFSIDGRLVHQLPASKAADSWQKRINLSHLPAGSYFVHVRLKNLAWVQPLVKQ